PPICKRPQPVQYNGRRCSAPDIANDSAHVWSVVAAVSSGKIARLERTPRYDNNAKQLPERADAELLRRGNTTSIPRRIAIGRSFSGNRDPRATARYDATNPRHPHGPSSGH